MIVSTFAAKNKIMTLKEISQHFKVIKWENTYKIHSLTIGGRSVYKYLCSVEKSGTKFNVIGYKKTGAIEELKAQVVDYVLNLEYDSEYFDPAYTEGIKEVHFVHDYLRELGFKNKSNSYVYNPKNIYGGKTTEIIISFYGLDVFGGWNEFNPKEVKICLSTGAYSWVSLTVERNMKAIQEGIDSLIKPLLLSEIARNTTTSDKLETIIKDLTINSIDGFEINSSDYKKELKEKLLEIIEKL